MFQFFCLSNGDTVENKVQFERERDYERIMRQNDRKLLCYHLNQQWLNRNKMCSIFGSGEPMINGFMVFRIDATLSNTNSLTSLHSHTCMHAAHREKHILNLDILYLSSKWNISFIWSEYKQPRKYVTLSRSDQSSVCHLHSVCYKSMCESKSICASCELGALCMSICCLHITHWASGGGCVCVHFENTLCGSGVWVCIPVIFFSVLCVVFRWSPEWKRNRSMFLYQIFSLISFCCKQYRITYQKMATILIFSSSPFAHIWFSKLFRFVWIGLGPFLNLMAIGHL